MPKQYKPRQRPPVVYQSETTYEDPVEQQMRDENLAARPNYTEKGLRSLAAAISMQAVMDYKTAIMGLPFTGKYNDGWPVSEKVKEIEKFFEGEIFQSSIGHVETEKVKRLIRQAPFEQIRSTMAMVHPNGLRKRGDEDESA